VQGSTDTEPLAINDQGSITGVYADSTQAFHGFVGTPRSGFTSFDPPNSTFTEATGINDNGYISGSYETSGN
jgi:hypothetical protein